MVPELPWARTLRRQHVFGARAGAGGHRRPGATGEECLVFLLRQVPICHALLEALVPRRPNPERVLGYGFEDLVVFTHMRNPGALAAWALCHMYGDVVPYLVEETERRTCLLRHSSARLLELAWVNDCAAAFHVVDGVWRERGFVPGLLGRKWGNILLTIATDVMTAWQREAVVALANRMERGQYNGGSGGSANFIVQANARSLLYEALMLQCIVIFTQTHPYVNVTPVSGVLLIEPVLGARPDMLREIMRNALRYVGQHMHVTPMVLAEWRQRACTDLLKVFDASVDCPARTDAERQILTLARDAAATM